MAYSTGKKTFIIFHEADKTASLNGFWSEEAIRKYAERRNYKGKISVFYDVLNYSKYGMDRTEQSFELEIE